MHRFSFPEVIESYLDKVSNAQDTVQKLAENIDVLSRKVIGIISEFQDGEVTISECMDNLVNHHNQFIRR